MNTETTPAPRKSTPLKVNRFRFNLTGAKLFGVLFKNNLLTVMTLGFYAFRAKVAKRKLITSSYVLAGQPFEYTGTAHQAAMGFLKFFGLLFVFGVVAGTVSAMAPSLKNIHGGTIVFLGIIPLIHYALRYRIRHISYRGIPFSYDQPFSSFTAGFIVPVLVKVFTFGLAAPYADARMRDNIVNACSYSDVPFRLKTNTTDLWGVHIITWLLFLPTLGMARCWYTAALRRRVCAGLSLGELRFKSTTTGKDLLLLHLGNIGILIFTLLLGYPWVICRRARFFTAHTIIGGDVEGFLNKRTKTMEPSPIADSALPLDGILGAI